MYILKIQRCASTPTVDTINSTCSKFEYAPRRPKWIQLFVHTQTSNMRLDSQSGCNYLYILKIHGCASTPKVGTIICMTRIILVMKIAIIIKRRTRIILILTFVVINSNSNNDVLLSFYIQSGIPNPSASRPIFPNLNRLPQPM